MPLLTYGDITEVGQNKMSKTLVAAAQRFIFIYLTCPRCNLGLIKLGFIKNGCDAKKIHVCLDCRTFFLGSYV